MENRDFSNLGQEIKSIVQDAINTRDFQKLNNDIGNTVNSALEEVKASMKWTSDKYTNHKTDYNAGNTHPTADYKTNTYTGKKFDHNYKTVQARDYYTQITRQPQILAVKKPPGRVSGVLYIVGGSVGFTISTVVLIVSSIVSAFGGGAGILGSIMWLLPLIGVSTGSLMRGVHLRKRVGRFKRYVKQLGTRRYCPVKELADRTGKTEKYIVRDLQKMIRLGMFPEGCMDEEQTCLMLDRDTLSRFNTMKKSIAEQQQMKQQQLEEQKKEEAKKAELTNEEKEIKKIIDEGESYIKTIKEINDALPQEDISKKLDMLETVTGKIFTHIETHPEQIPEIRKFMEYYLPITLKLVTAYRDFEAQPIQGKNITSAKVEIENTLDTINEAFLKLLDSLFEDAAMDVSTDITVLQTMLAQEGLTKPDFNKE